MKKHRLRIIIVPLIAIIAAVWVVYHYARSSPKGTGEESSRPGNTATGAHSGGGKPVPVTVHIAEYMSLDEGIRTVGTLLPYEEVDVASETSGRVDRIAFEEGAYMKKGSLLLKVNDDDLQSQLTRAKFQRDLIKERLDRNRILLEKDAISREAFDQIETDYNLIQTDIQLLNIKIEKTEIRAPFDGKTGFRNVSIGTYMQPGTLITHMVDASKLKVEFAIPEKYGSLARAGATVSFTVEGSPAIRTAQVYAVDSKVDVRTRTIAMRALYSNADNALTPGMFASVVAGQKLGRTLQVPTQAIVPLADSRTVWVVRNGKAVSVPVTTGTRGESTIEITQGISQGDSVIITGLLQVREGSPLQIMN